MLSSRFKCLLSLWNFFINYISPREPQIKSSLKSSYELNRNTKFPYWLVSLKAKSSRIFMLDIKVLRERPPTSVRLLREILAGERSTRNSSKASLNCFSMGHSEKLKANERKMRGRERIRARVCDGIGRSHKFPYGMHTPTGAFTYARCMITAALRSDGQVALGSPAHADVLRGREWNLKRERVNVKENVRKGRKTARGNGNRDRRSDRYPTYVSISRDSYRGYRGEERRRGFPSFPRKISRSSNRKILSQV